jgi:hypothetical protein
MGEIGFAALPASLHKPLCLALTAWLVSLFPLIWKDCDSESVEAANDELTHAVQGMLKPGPPSAF